MATTTETPSALFQALRSANVDPELAHRAALESRSQAGDNVIEIIGAQLSEFRSEVNARFDSVNARFDSVNACFDSVNARFDSVDARIDSVDARIDSVDARIDSVGTRIDSVGTRIDSVERSIKDLRQIVWRVIWPLLIFLSVPIFSLLYKVLTS